MAPLSILVHLGSRDVQRGVSVVALGLPRDQVTGCSHTSSAAVNFSSRSFSAEAGCFLRK